MTTKYFLTTAIALLLLSGFAALPESAEATTITSTHYVRVMPGSSECTRPGDLCQDTTYFAGELNGKRFFLTSVDFEGILPWMMDCSFCTIGLTLNRDNSGYINTYEVLWNHTNSPGKSHIGLDGFPAAKHCGTLSAHGHDDWFLPSTRELRQLGMGLHDACVGNGRCGAEINFDEHYYAAGYHGVSIADSVMLGIDNLSGVSVSTEKPVRCFRQEDI